MLSQNKKKIHIINFNPKDFFDLTLEALEKLQTSDLIISTRELDRKFRSNLNKINSALEINTGLLKNRTKCIKYLISKLNKFNSVLINFGLNPFIFNLPWDIHAATQKVPHSILSPIME